MANKKANTLDISEPAAFYIGLPPYNTSRVASEPESNNFVKPELVYNKGVNRGHYLFHRGVCPPGLGLSVANSTLPALPPRKPRAAQQPTHIFITKNVNCAHINQRQLKLFAAMSWTNSGNRKRLKAFKSTKPSHSHLIYPPTRAHSYAQYAALAK